MHTPRSGRDNGQPRQGAVSAPREAGRSSGAKGPRRSAASRLPSILARQHDGENAKRRGGVCRILAAVIMAGAEGSAIIIVDLPKDARPFMVERAEVMLPVRVVVLGEGVERLHLLRDSNHMLQAKGAKAGRKNLLA